MSRPLWVLVLTAFLCVGVAGIVAPLLDASRYGEGIRQTLEATLGRTVQFEAVHFTLFAGPGFTLEGVTIGEDPRYGIEVFAYVPEMEVRVRPDKLLFRQIQISSLRLLEPSLNLVKREDGTWNALELVQRLSAPRRMPLNFFPVFEVLRGRIDFKFGTRKTTLYLLNSDFQIFPEHSNKLNLRFSGSPARTDRAGNGFGHLRGTVNWSLNAKDANDNQLEADLTLDPSNLSEMTTLVEGHDVGVHGTVSSHAVIQGPLAALQVRGQMQLGDVHRWDLLPASGNEWQVRYGGNIDLVSNHLDLRTASNSDGVKSPITLQLLVNNFLTNPDLSLLAHFEQVPAGEVLPLGRRMGLPLPTTLALGGNLAGDIRFTNEEGLAGNLSLNNVTATIPQVDSVHADHLEASLVDDRIAFRPAEIRTSGGVLHWSGDAWLASSRSDATVRVDNYPVSDLRRTLKTWLGESSPLDLLAQGQVSGGFSYNTFEDAPPDWSGKFDFDDGVIHLPGLASPLSAATGRVNFAGSSLDVTRFSARVGDRIVQATYRYNGSRESGSHDNTSRAGTGHASFSGKRRERLHLEVASAELGEIQSLLAPTVQGQGWLARLGVTNRPVPAWLSERDMDADISVKRLLAGDLNLGSLTSQLAWQGTNLRFSSVKLKMPAGTLQAHGSANLVSYRPACSFVATITEFPWRGGLLNADAEVETTGLIDDALKNLRASGTFAGTNLRLTPDDVFPNAAGAFLLTYQDGWPNLRISNLQASDRNGDWTGSGAAQSDGHLVIDLERGIQQRRVVSTLLDVPDSGALVAVH